MDESLAVKLMPYGISPSNLFREICLNYLFEDIHWFEKFYRITVGDCIDANIAVPDFEIVRCKLLSWMKLVFRLIYCLAQQKKKKTKDLCCLPIFFSSLLK